MFSGEREQSREIARQLVSDVNALSLALARIQVAQENDAQTFKRLEEEIKALAQEIREIKNGDSSLGQKIDAIASRTEDLERFVATERRNREEGREDARAIKVSLVTQILISLLTGGAILLGTVYRLTHPPSLPPAEQAEDK